MHTETAELLERCQPCLQVTDGSRDRVQVKDGQVLEVRQGLEDFLRDRSVVVQQLQLRQLQSSEA